MLYLKSIVLAAEKFFTGERVLFRGLYNRVFVYKIFDFLAVVVVYELKADKYKIACGDGDKQSRAKRAYERRNVQSYNYKPYYKEV